MAKIKTLVQMIRQGSKFRTKAAKRAEAKKSAIEGSPWGQVAAEQDRRRKEKEEALAEEERKKNKRNRKQTTMTGTRTSRDADAVLRRIKGK